MPTKENGSGGQQEYDPNTGKFSSKGDWGSFSAFVQRNSPYKSDSARNPKKLGYNPQTIQKSDYEAVKAKFPFLDDIGLAELPETSDLLSAGIDLHDGKEVSQEDYSKAVAKIKEKYASDQSEQEKKFSQFQKGLKARQDSLAKAMKQAGFNDIQAVKAIAMQKRFAKAQEEANKELGSLGPHATGYSKGKSVRDLKATIEGRFPLSQASEILGVSTDKVKKFFDTNGEWHHTGGGGFFNKTDFYDLSFLDKFANEYGEGEDPKSDEYAKAVETLKNLYGGFSSFKQPKKE